MRLARITPWLAWLVLGPAVAGPGASVDTLLARDAPPPGIVFEFESDDEGLLERHLPPLRGEIARLQRRFPGLDIEIVSHGQELLSLTTENETFYPAAHRITRQLAEAGIPLSVCGAYADTFEAYPEDFPDYVEVLPSGPAHVNNLEALDYVVIPYP